jgi:hypothetical protein
MRKEGSAAMSEQLKAWWECEACRWLKALYPFEDARCKECAENTRPDQEARDD